MKKKAAVLLTGIMTASLLLSGCQSSKGIENDNLKISQYKGVEIDEVDKADDVTDKDVTSFIDSVRESNAKTKTIKNRAVKKGDTVTIDFVGKMNGKKFDNGSANNQKLKIGSNTLSRDLKTVSSDTKLGTSSYGMENSQRTIPKSLQVRKLVLQLR